LSVGSLKYANEFTAGSRRKTVETAAEKRSRTFFVFAALKKNELNTGRCAKLDAVIGEIA
jgi:hypothetical protein